MPPPPRAPSACARVATCDAVAGGALVIWRAGAVAESEGAPCAGGVRGGEPSGRAVFAVLGAGATVAGGVSGDVVGAAPAGLVRLRAMDAAAAATARAPDAGGAVAASAAGEVADAAGSMQIVEVTRGGMGVRGRSARFSGLGAPAAGGAAPAPAPAPPRTAAAACASQAARAPEGSVRPSSARALTTRGSAVSSSRSVLGELPTPRGADGDRTLGAAAITPWCGAPHWQPRPNATRKMPGAACAVVTRASCQQK